MANEQGNGIAVAKQLVGTIENASTHDRQLVEQLLHAQIEGASARSRSGPANGYRATIAAIVALALVIVSGLAGFISMVQSQLEDEISRVEQNLGRILEIHGQLDIHPKAGERLTAVETAIANFNGLKKDVENLKTDYYGVGHRYTPKGE